MSQTTHQHEQLEIMSFCLLMTVLLVCASMLFALLKMWMHCWFIFSLVSAVNRKYCVVKLLLSQVLPSLYSHFSQFKMLSLVKGHVSMHGRALHHFMNLSGNITLNAAGLWLGLPFGWCWFFPFCLEQCWCHMEFNQTASDTSATNERSFYMSLYITGAKEMKKH